MLIPFNWFPFYTAVLGNPIPFFGRKKNWDQWLAETRHSHKYVGVREGRMKTYLVSKAATDYQIEVSFDVETWFLLR